MIGTRLMGRLGNNLFQYAVAFGLSKKWNIPYQIPTQSLNPSIWPSYSFPGINYSDSIIKNALFFKEKEHSYQEIPFHEDIILEGYWQSYKYIDHCREDFLCAVGFEPIDKSDLAAIHIRIGDYRLYPTRHPIVTSEYLTSAIQLLCDKGFGGFLIYSDTPEDAKKLIRNDLFPTKSFSFKEIGDPVSDLFHMAMHPAIVISNSSYSWWAAYMNQFPDKIVVAPNSNSWFGVDNRHLSTKDLLPENWIQI